MWAGGQVSLRVVNATWATQYSFINFRTSSTQIDFLSSNDPIMSLLGYCTPSTIMLIL
jgi:hypothetical protein